MNTTASSSAQVDAGSTPLTMRQAVEFYNGTFCPPVVGVASDSEVFGQTVASTLAAFAGLPLCLSASAGTGTSSFSVANRATAAAFFRRLANALES